MVFIRNLIIISSVTRLKRLNKQENKLNTKLNNKLKYSKFISSYYKFLTHKLKIKKLRTKLTIVNKINKNKKKKKLRKLLLLKIKKEKKDIINALIEIYLNRVYKNKNIIPNVNKTIKKGKIFKKKISTKKHKIIIKSCKKINKFIKKNISLQIKNNIYNKNINQYTFIRYKFTNTSNKLLIQSFFFKKFIKIKFNNKIKYKIILKKNKKYTKYLEIFLNFIRIKYKKIISICDLVKNIFLEKNKVNVKLKIYYLNITLQHYKFLLNYEYLLHNSLYVQHNIVYNNDIFVLKNKINFLFSVFKLNSYYLQYLKNKNYKNFLINFVYNNYFINFNKLFIFKNNNKIKILNVKYFKISKFLNILPVQTRNIILNNKIKYFKYARKIYNLFKLYNLKYFNKIFILKNNIYKNKKKKLGFKYLISS
jgi:hypothetical protein